MTLPLMVTDAKTAQSMLDALNSDAQTHNSDKFWAVVVMYLKWWLAAEIKKETAAPAAAPAAGAPGATAVVTPVVTPSTPVH